MKLYYTHRAKQDVELAFLWYEKQRKGLGHDFLACMDAMLGNIIEFPEMYSASYKNFRRALLRKFPFSVFYTIEKNDIILHAVFDNRQSPLKRP